MWKRETVLLFGCGRRFIENKKSIENKYHIAAIADCDYSKHGKCGEYDVIPPSKIRVYSFDKIIITPKEFQSILAVLQALEFPNEQIELFVDENEYGHMWNRISKMPLYDGRIYCKFDNIHFYIKNRSDYMVMNDIFGKNGWDFYCRDEIVVVDIGMNIGLSCLYFANMKNVDCVYGYEPFLQTYNQALNNFKRNSHEIQNKIQTINCGLTDRESQIEVSYNPLYTTNMRVDDGKRTYGEKEENAWIQTRSAATQIQMIIERHINKKIVLKIDCEGSEYPIFRDLEAKGILEKIYMVLMETHDGRENEIKQCLRDWGFIYFDNYVGAFPKLGFLYAVNPGK